MPDKIYFIFLFILWIIQTSILLFICYKVSKKKGMPSIYTLLGILGLIGVIIVFVLPERKKQLQSE